MTDPTTPSPYLRAAEAARSVVTVFGARLWHLPGTHLGKPYVPRPSLLGARHYWWQAQYLDGLVDAGWRMLSTGGPAAARPALTTADALLRTMWLRNGFRYVNPYYDDMAWLLLASGRLAALHDAVDEVGTRGLRTVEHVLLAQIESAHTDEHGGGLWWHAVRDFKNVPATGPAAIHFARTGQTERAAALVDWCYDALRDDATGLFFDGLRTIDGVRFIERNVYTYNQGTVLGAVLALGDPESLRRASELVEAVAAHLTLTGTDVLVTHETHDQALFTGILVRYLAPAATDERLSPTTRDTAARLVQGTADRLWSGRSRRRLRLGRRSVEATVFSHDTMLRAGDALDLPSVIELSGQVQAWSVFEAAAVVALHRGARE